LRNATSPEYQEAIQEFGEEARLELEVYWLREWGRFLSLVSDIQKND